MTVRFRWMVWCFLVCGGLGAGFAGEPKGLVFALDEKPGLSGEAKADDLLDASAPASAPQGVFNVVWAGSGAPGALVFQGPPKSFISYGQGAENELQITGNFTVFARVRASASAERGQPLGYFVAKSQGFDNADNHSWYLTRNERGELRVGLSADGKNYRVVTGGSVGEGEWADVAFSFGSTSPGSGLLRLFVNGEEVASKELPFDAVFNAEGCAFCIGNAHNGHNQFHGEIQKVRVFNRILPVEEIRQVGRAGVESP